LECYERAIKIDGKYSNGFIGKGNAYKKLG
jgi:hypothetical protein